MTTVVIGANGQLGSELRQTFKDHDLVPVTHAECEVTDPAQVRETVRKYHPALVLNTAAYHRVDECEDEPERAFSVNALAVRDLAIAAKEIGSVLVHFSTDYVFDGRQRHPYREVDPPGPLSVYATLEAGGGVFRARGPRQAFIRDGERMPLRKIHAWLERSPIMEIHPTDERNNDYSNWWSPNIECLRRMLETSGFLTELAGRWADCASFRAYRLGFHPPAA